MGGKLLEKIDLTKCDNSSETDGDEDLSEGASEINNVNQTQNKIKRDRE